MDGWLGEWRNELIDEKYILNSWIDGLTDEWMDRWMDGEMHT